jgi:hypothetical protein
VLYLCEASGARLLRYGIGISQIGTNYQLDVETHDQAPAGPVGDVLFRSIDVAGRATAGYHLGVTPIVDGVSESEQTFSGADVGEIQCQAFFAKRGTRVAARVRTLSRTGDVEIHDIAESDVVIRSTP